MTRKRVRRSSRQGTKTRRIDSIRTVKVPGCGKGISVVDKIPHSPPESVPL